MKKSLVVVAAVVLSLGIVGTSCGGSQKATSSTVKGVGSPFGEVYEAPCSTQDEDDYFVGTGIASGSKERMDVLQTSALTNAQNIVRQKMKHAYKGVIGDYSNYIGDNQGANATVHVERAGDQIIDAIINNTKAWCGPKFSSVDDKGHVTCYVGIKISTKEVVDKIADKLSKEKELQIRFEEDNFRKSMDEKFKKFRENQ